MNKKTKKTCSTYPAFPYYLLIDTIGVELICMFIIQTCFLNLFCMAMSQKMCVQLYNTKH